MCIVKSGGDRHTDRFSIAPFASCGVWWQGGTAITGRLSVRTNGQVHRFYGSWQWRKCRQAYWSMRGGLCQRCLQYGLYTPGAQVHHKTRLTADNVNDVSIALNADNLQLLCERCHHEQHDLAKRIKPGRRRWMLDADGNVLSRDV